jgi:fructose-1-phosphate kinase PfkB-like protein
MSSKAGGAYLCVCLNPVIQKTLVFPRLAAGEVNRTAEHRVDASGKGVNVARVITESGRPSLHLTQAGGVNRDWFLSLCSRDGLELRTVDSGSEIRFCYTVIEAGEGRATELVEEALPVAPATTGAILEAFDACLPGCRAVIFSGTKAAGFDPLVLPRMAQRARAAGLPFVLDLKGPDLLACLAHGPLVAKPNLQEFLSTWPAAMGDAASGEGPGEALARIRGHAERVARELYLSYGTHLVLTRGHEATWFWDGSRLAEAPVHPVAALNPTGSGDAFTAGMAMSLVEAMASGSSPASAMAAAVAEGMRLGGLNAARLRPGSIR